MKLPIFFAILLMGGFALALDCQSPLKEPLTSEGLDKAKQECHIRTTTDLRYILPAGFRSNFTFLRHSASAFSTCISPERFSPRLLMFSPRSRLVIAMPWNPEMVGHFNCNGFETMELKPHATKLTLTLHSLPPIPPARHQVPRRIDPVLKCSFCHGESGTPRWAKYSDWNKNGTVAYGAEDDLLYRGSEEEAEYKRFLKHIEDDHTKDTLIWPKNDSKAYLKVLSLRLSHPGSRSEIIKDAKRDGFDKHYMDFPPYQSTPKDHLQGSNFDYRANTKLTGYLHKLNTTKIYNTFVKNPDYSKLRLILAYVVAGCAGDANDRPRSDVSKRIPKAFATDDGFLRESGLTQWVTDSSQYQLASFRRTDFPKFSKYIGLSEEDYTLDPSASVRFGFTDGEGDTLSLLSALTLVKDPQFSSYLRGGNPAVLIAYAGIKFCEKVLEPLEN